MRDIVLSSMCVPFTIGTALYYGSSYGYYLVAVILFALGFLCGMSVLALFDMDIRGRVITPRSYRSKS
jgi:hypothetical protein